MNVVLLVVHIHMMKQVKSILLQHGRIMEMENIVEHVRNVMKMLQKITIMDQTTNVQNVVQCKHVNIIGQQIKMQQITGKNVQSVEKQEIRKDTQ